MSARVVIVVVLALATAAAADPFKPPSSNAAAQQRYAHGKELFHAKKYTEAAAEFAAAYQLDPDAKFLVYNLAVAQRMAGACDDAIASYREFLVAAPPADQAANARTGIERCEQQIAAQIVALPPTTPVPTERVPDEPATAARPPPVEPPLVAQPSTVAAEPKAESRKPKAAWYRDGAGATLVASGAVCAIGSGVIYLLARQAASDTFTATTLATYNDRRDAASTYQTASAIAGIAAIGLVAAGAIRYATRPRATIAIAPAPRGAAVSVELRW